MFSVNVVINVIFYSKMAALYTLVLVSEHWKPK